MDEPTTEAGKRLLASLTGVHLGVTRQVCGIEAEAARATLQSLRERVEGLFIPADYVRDNGVDGKMTWPDGWDSGIERVLAEIDRAIAPPSPKSRTTTNAG
jgi:hypothetical protein